MPVPAQGSLPSRGLGGLGHQRHSPVFLLHRLVTMSSACTSRAAVMGWELHGLKTAHQSDRHGDPARPQASQPGDADIVQRYKVSRSLQVSSKTRHTLYVSGWRALLLSSPPYCQSSQCSQVTVHSQALIILFSVGSSVAGFAGFAPACQDRS